MESERTYGLPEAKLHSYLVNKNTAVVKEKPCTFIELDPVKIRRVMG
jgi:hypothetical protein